jgi:hypothetical protein
MPAMPNATANPCRAEHRNKHGGLCLNLHRCTGDVLFQDLALGFDGGPVMAAVREFG